MKKAVVLGASGSTGRLLVRALLKKGVHVMAIVRNAASFKELFDGEHSALEIVEADISNITISELSSYIDNCEAVLSCLGHNPSFKGVFGEPRRLVTESVKKVSEALKSGNTHNKTKFVLMNTTGNCNQDIPEKPPFSQRLVIFILRHLLPPHADNEDAANLLRTEIGQNSKDLQWVVVRPDGLVDNEEVTDFDIFASPIRNAIFNAGSTSRINVAEFMSELIVNSELWNKWVGQMPVIYNRPQ